jgi:hypothetical protein
MHYAERQHDYIVPLRSRDGYKAEGPGPRPQPVSSLVQLPRLRASAVVPWISRWKCTEGSEVFDTLRDPHNSWPLEAVHHVALFKRTKIPTHSLAPLSGPRTAAGIEISAFGRHFEVLLGSEGANRIKQLAAAPCSLNDCFAYLHSPTLLLVD